MTILFLVRLYKPHIGGVEEHVEGVSKNLINRHNIKIITEKFDSTLKDFEIIDGIEVYRINPGNKWHTWVEMFKLFNLLNSADIIHAHDVYFWIIPYKLLHWTKKTFITFHGWEGVYPIPWKNKLQHTIAEKLSRGNICVGDYLIKWYGTKPDFVTYGAV